MEVGGKTVTAVRDRRNGRYRKQIVVPLFAVADWLVDNWWYLWHEPAHTQKQEQKPGFEDRHNLAHAGNGFLLPKLTIAPSSERIHMVAERWDPAHASIAFVEEVDAYVEVEELREEFQRLIDVVLRRLRTLGDEHDVGRLSEAWAAIHDLEPEEREFSRAAAMCGIDPFDVEDGVSQAISEFWERTDSSIREEALAAADVHLLPELGDWLGTVVEDLEDLASVGNANLWIDIRNAMPAARSQEPWKQGYEAARLVRDHLELGQDKCSFDGPFAIFHRERESPSRRIEGIVAATAPACVMVPQRRSSKRFLMARALGDFVSRREPRLGILGSQHNDRQARSRAFAAEFLAPAEVLYGRWITSDAPDEEVDELSREFDVSTRVIWHQIDNYERAVSDT